MAKQASHIDQAGGKKGDDKHLVHRWLPGAFSGKVAAGFPKENATKTESPAQHERDSGPESQSLFS